MTLDQFKAWVARGIDKAGGQTKFAEKHGVDQSILSLVMTGKREPSEAFVKALGWRKIITYSKEAKP